LTIGKICWIDKDLGGFVKVDFFDKNRFYRFVPPSWILNIQTQWFLIVTSRKHKTHKRFLKFGQLAAKIIFFSFLGALDFDAILDFRSKTLQAGNIFWANTQHFASKIVQNVLIGGAPIDFLVKKW
jgi:hypothetical protein